MAKDHPDIVKKALLLKKIGNGLMTLLGGREIHPVNPRVGGFYKAPSKKELNVYAEQLKIARDLACETVELVSTFSFPDIERDYELVSLRHPDEYPFNEGRLVSNKGLDIDISEFEDHFEETHVKRSTALHCGIKERGAYLTGPLARYSLNFDRLPPICKEAAKKAGLGDTCKNPFKSIIVRAVEVLFACDEALRIIEAYEEPDHSYVEITPIAATGFGCTEAPRGFCWHRYEIDGDGIIAGARIVPPTSQNQPTIESDLRHVVESNMELDDKKLKLRLEQTIRNHDPCISCSTHFLDLKIDRG
jgi:coenzyme F420-reducing hydrogenase alpha subunit